MHHADLLGGLQASLRGITTTIAPVLLFVSLLGPQAMAASFWAALITATLVPAVHMLLKSRSGVIPGARMASLAAYISLVIAMTDSAGHTSGHATAMNLSAEQLRVGLAAGSLMFLATSVLIWLFGALRVGNLFKMIPMPVTAGISNGTALLLLTLAVDKLTHHGGTAMFTASAMVACFLIWPRVQALSTRLKQVPAVVISLLAGLLMAMLMEPSFHTTMPSGTSDWSWVSVRLWPGLAQNDLMHLIRFGLPNVLTLALVMILETFTAANEMEQRFGVRVDANRELMVLGGSNMVSALLGGVPCTGHNSRSIASWMAGGRGVRVALVGLALTGVLLLVLDQWLMALPVGMAFGGSWQKSLAGGAGLGLTLFLLFDRLLDVVLPSGLLYLIFGGRSWIPCITCSAGSAWR